MNSQHTNVVHKREGGVTMSHVCLGKVIMSHIYVDYHCAKSDILNYFKWCHYDSVKVNVT